MSTHRVFLDQGLADIAPGSLLRVVGDQAKHALRVKRLEAGDAIELLDGRGHLAAARLESSGKASRDDWWLDARIDHVLSVPRVLPEIRVWSAVPKGQRLSDMIESLSQAGARSWGALESARSISDAGEHKIDRIRKIAEESSKQCGRAWVLDIESPRTLESFSGAGEHEDTPIFADASGTPLRSVPIKLEQPLDVLIGPEGGWSEDELARAKSRRWRIARAGPHVMRIETAAAITASIILGMFDA